MALPLGLFDRVIGLNGSTTFSVPATGRVAEFVVIDGAGVEKSIRSSSPCLLGDFDDPLPELLLRVSSKLGIAFGGVRGIVGFRIDLMDLVGEG